MPSLDQVLPAVLIAVMVIVLLAFTFGTQRSIARGNAMLAWLQGALPQLGKRATLRWLGSSVAEVRLVDPAPPFRELAVLAVMEPRDVPIMWAVTRVRGRRDLLIVRGSMVRPPTLELDVADPGAWDTGGRPEGEEGWHALEWSGDAIALVRGEPGPAVVDGVRASWDRLDAASAGVWRLAIRQTVPHLEVHV